MSVERLLQIHLAALTTIGAILLGMGQRDSLLPLLGVFAAVSSVIFTDVLKWFQLHRIVANLAAVAAFFVSAQGFLDTDTRGQLAAVAKLLIYMQVVLFYQQKNPRLYWQLSLLSLLQVVVAAALNVRIESGLLLIVYALLSISAVALLFVHRELLNLTDSAPSSRRSWHWNSAESASATVPSPRLPRVTPMVSAATLGQAILNWAFVRQLSGVGLTTFAFALVLFFAAPRHDDPSRRLWNVRPVHVVGFSSTVKLGDLDEVLQSNDLVMRLTFREARTNQPYRVFGDPYLRGGVLTHYECRGSEGRWRQPGRASEAAPQSGEDLVEDSLAMTRRLLSSFRNSSSQRLPRPPKTVPYIRQDIVLEPIREPVLFSIYPAYVAPDTPGDVRFLPMNEQLVRAGFHESDQRAEYRYSLFTTGIRGGLQLDATPHLDRPLTPAGRWLLEQELAAASRIDRARFPRLAAIADEIAEQQRVLRVDRVSLVRALRNHFQVPGRYAYTLDFRQLARNPEVDPIEDFVANHHTGHCVYFASALVMMLRSQGIPARLVTGFQCADYNSVGGYYQVLQRHAHAWAEAYLEPPDMEAILPPDSDTNPSGGWMRLDPTPGADQGTSAQTQKGWLGLVDDSLDYARTVWSDYILGLTAKRQRETIFAPVAEKTDPRALTAFFKRLAERRSLLLDLGGVFWRHRWKWLLAALITASAVLYWRRKSPPAEALRVIRRLAGRWSGHPPEVSLRHSSRYVAFYRRFEDLLAKFGWTRAAGQTPREFAQALVAHPRVAVHVESVRPLAESVVSAFYRVRFGLAVLEESETQALDSALAHLERLLQAANAAEQARG